MFVDTFDKFNSYVVFDECEGYLKSDSSYTTDIFFAETFKSQDFSEVDVGDGRIVSFDLEMFRILEDTFRFTTRWFYLKYLKVKVEFWFEYSPHLDVFRIGDDSYFRMIRPYPRCFFYIPSENGEDELCLSLHRENTFDRFRINFVSKNHEGEFRFLFSNEQVLVSRDPPLILPFAEGSALLGEISDHIVAVGWDINAKMLEKFPMLFHKKIKGVKYVS